MPVHGGGGPGGLGGAGPGPGVHGPGPGGFGPGRGSRSGGMFSGIAHVAFGGRGIFSNRGTATTGVAYDSLSEKYAYEYLESETMKNQTNQPNPTSSPAPSDTIPSFMQNRTTYFASHYLAILGAIYISMSVFANILAAQVWHLGPFQLDAGILVYPLVYITLDVTTEIFHKEISNRIVNWACAANILCMIALGLCRILPGVDGIENVNLATALNFSTVIFIASIVGTWFGGHVNNRIYEKLRRRTHPDAINTRSWVSSMFGRFVDTCIFSSIAFLFRMPFAAFLNQLCWSFLAAITIETILGLLHVKGFIARAIRNDLESQGESPQSDS